MTSCYLAQIHRLLRCEEFVELDPLVFRQLAESGSELSCLGDRGLTSAVGRLENLVGPLHVYDVGLTGERAAVEVDAHVGTSACLRVELSDPGDDRRGLPRNSWLHLIYPPDHVHDRFLSVDDEAEDNRSRPASCLSVDPIPWHLMKRADFEAVVDRALENLPDWVFEEVDNLHVVVEDTPPPDLDGALGVYEGVSLKERSADYWGVLPDRIVIFVQPHLEMGLDRAELESEIRKTVLHELGHHLGIDDHRLTELGWD